MMKSGIGYCFVIALSITVFSSKLYAQSSAVDTSLTGLYNVIKSLSDAKMMASAAEEVMKKSGPNAAGIQDQCCKYVAIGYAAEGNLEKTLYWLDRCNEAATKRLGVTSAMKEFLDAKRADLAERFLNSATVTASNLEKSQFDGLKGTLLVQQGQYKQAIASLRPAYEKTGRYAELYATALLKAGEAQQVFEAVNNIVLQQHHLSDPFKADLKNLYVKKYGNAQRFNFIADSIMAVQNQEIAKKVAKMAIDEPAPDFELTDLKGKSVSLKSLRGKTIFIDFWATWCGPCVGSFPGMQKAVDYYKNDSTVVFLFVHAYERVPNALVEVKRFMDSKKYRFDVYMDLGSPVAKRFKVSNLPTKLIIDQDGVLKVRSVGYLMEDEAIPEVKAMIELSRKGG